MPVRTRRKQPKPADPGETFVHLPRFGSVYDAERRYGVSRRSLFRFAQEAPRAVRRFGFKTLWDFAVMDELFDKLPTAAEAPSHQQKNLAKARAVRAAKEAAAKEAAEKASAANPDQ